jgi:predicted AlkP superfamily phosphohydrolase/phosphomutase
MSNSNRNPKTIVFGLDGAHFELIKPLLKSGQLPNINSVISSGVTADLQSVLPPVISPNWKAYLTGKNPGKIGIYW